MDARTVTTKDWLRPSIQSARTSSPKEVDCENHGRQAQLVSIQSHGRTEDVGIRDTSWITVWDTCWRGHGKGGAYPIYWDHVRSPHCQKSRAKIPTELGLAVFVHCFVYLLCTHTWQDLLWDTRFKYKHMSLNMNRPNRRSYWDPAKNILCFALSWVVFH